MKKIAALIAVLLLAAPARAIELSLEENRAERGSVGYVDMQRLFADSPDAQRAKEGFQELIRQAEERVNLRKAELLKMRQQLELLRAQRDTLVASSATAPSPAPFFAPPPSAPSSAPTPASAAPPVPAAAAAPSTAAASVAAAPPPAAKTIALPGMAPNEPALAAPAASTGTNAGLERLLAAPVAASTKTASVAAVAPSTAAASAPAVAASSATPAAVPAAPPAPSGPTLGQQLLEIDGKIIALQAEIAKQEGELTREHEEADHGLLDVESRKTDQVLARLYRAITEVARREGVSVVIEKSTILYGHPAVDITDKVLKYLKEASPQP